MISHIKSSTTVYKYLKTNLSIVHKGLSGHVDELHIGTMSDHIIGQSLLLLVLPLQSFITKLNLTVGLLQGLLCIPQPVLHLVHLWLKLLEVVQSQTELVATRGGLDVSVLIADLEVIHWCLEGGTLVLCETVTLLLEELVAFLDSLQEWALVD